MAAAAVRYGTDDIFFECDPPHPVMTPIPETPLVSSIERPLLISLDPLRWGFPWSRGSSLCGSSRPCASASRPISFLSTPSGPVGWTI